MAETHKYLDLQGLTLFWGKIKSKFLQLSGGTLTGSLKISKSGSDQLTIDRAESGASFSWVWLSINNTQAGAFGASPDHKPYFHATGSNNYYQLLHTGNYTSTMDGRYVKLDAGAAEQTIKSSIGNIANGTLEIWRATSGGYPMIGFANGTTKTKLGFIGFGTTANVPIFRTTTGTDYKLWHAGNDGSGSGLDADTVDGKHASDFALSSHNHNGGAAKTAWGQTYVNAGGVLQTISGNMTSVGTITATGDNTITKSSTEWAKFKVTNNNGSVSLGSSTNRGVYDETKSQWIIATNAAGTNMWTASSASVKFGIGTDSPTEKLQVEGNIKSSGSVEAGTYIRAKSNDVYLGTASGSQGHIQYDNTVKCIKFIFD